jgi:hypothetical protein
MEDQARTNYVHDFNPGEAITLGTTVFRVTEIDPDFRLIWYRVGRYKSYRKHQGDTIVFGARVGDDLYLWTVRATVTEIKHRKGAFLKARIRFDVPKVVEIARYNKPNQGELSFS